jgi:hypothetical protein
MRVLNVVATACIMMLAIGVAASAQTDRKKQNSGGVIAPKGTVFAPAGVKPKSPSNTAPRPSTMAPLTTKECTGLGGTVSSNTICKSGKLCKRQGEDGRFHEVCISAK